MTDFTLARDADGVAVITWDVPKRSMNVMSMQGFEELDALIDEALADEAVKGIVITSGKKDFAGGMDLGVIAGMKQSGGDEPARAVFEGVMRMHGVLRKIERAGMDPKTNKGGKPIAAALPGTAAWFDAPPEARKAAGALASRQIAPIGPADDGYHRFQLRFGPEGVAHPIDSGPRLGYGGPARTRTPRCPAAMTP